MKNKLFWKKAIEFVITILSAVLTTFGLQSVV